MIREISAVEYLPQATDLAMDHWREVAQATGVPEPDINPVLVQGLEQAGCLLTLGAFHGDALVGYSINVIGPTFDFQHLRVCQNEGIFAAKAHRGKLGLGLIRETVLAAQRRGAHRVTFHAYIGTGADALLSRLRVAGKQFQAYDIIYTMELTPCPLDSHSAPF